MHAHVAGGHGFIGSAVVRALLPHGHVVTRSGREPIPMDTRAQAHTLVWCAGAGRDEPQGLWPVHVEAACATVDSLPRLRAVVYVSSGEVYGVQPVPFTEASPRLGASPYAKAKMQGEDAVSALCWQRGLALAILRPAVVYGPGQAATSMLIPTLIAQLMQQQRVQVTAGEQTRDWVFVDDVAAAIATVVAGEREGVYNLGSGTELSVRKMIEKVEITNRCAMR
jgi:nucleoside-diphosphate-sugar epimerase